MKKLFSAAFAATLALSATPALAQNCDDETIAVVQKLGFNQNTVQGAFAEAEARGGSAREAAKAFANEHAGGFSPACKGQAAEELLRFAGISDTAPAAPASQPTAAATTSAPAGGGVMLDAEISELRALKAAGGNSPAEISALNERLARLEAKRSVQGPDLRPQIRRLEQQLGGLRTRPVTSLSAGDRKQLAALPGQIAAMQKAQKDAAGSAASAAENATIANGAATAATNASTKAKGHQTAAEKAAGRAEAAASKTSNGFGWSDWLLWALLAVITVVVIIVAWFNYEVARDGIVDTEDLALKADSKTVDDLVNLVNDLEVRLTDTEHQVGKKIVAIAADVEHRLARMKDGDELTTAVVVETVNYEVKLRKGLNSDVFIVSGVNGHTASNAVMVYNLNRVLRNAAWSERLNDKI